MVSKAFSILLCLVILQCRLAFSAAEQGLADSKPNGNQSISLSELVSTFRTLHHDAVDIHLVFMSWVAGYGEHLYSLPVDWSAECQATVTANLLMLEKLAISEEAFRLEGIAADNVTQDLKNRTELLEHPLELVCRKIEKLYAEQANLSSVFEKAKKDAANFRNLSPRPPYFHKLIKPDELILTLIQMSDVPEIAQIVAIASFVGPRGSKRWILFSRSCQVVAKDEKFADSMQSIFEKTIKDILPEIMVDDRVEKYKSTVDYKEKETFPSWWVANMMRIFYGYISKDPILKKEVDDTAMKIRNRYSKEDADFSKL